MLNDFVEEEGSEKHNSVNLNLNDTRWKETIESLKCVQVVWEEVFMKFFYISAWGSGVEMDVWWVFSFVSSKWCRGQSGSIKCPHPVNYMTSFPADGGIKKTYIDSN